MASTQEVKKYLAYWFQLGKKVLVKNGEATLQPQQVIAGDRYSHDFEQCWQQIISPESGECYLEGTEQTITELLTPNWEVNDCARCNMPVPQRYVGVSPLLCPCNDISGWPNTELPSPREPVNSQTHLREIHDRMIKKN